MPCRLSSGGLSASLRGEHDDAKIRSIEEEDVSNVYANWVQYGECERPVPPGAIC